jgi:hypothetical protein
MRLNRARLRVHTLALIASLMSAHAFAADVIVSVNGSNYDVSTVTVKFKDLSVTLKATPWWGDSSLAKSFSDAVQASLGTPNPGNLGPYFAFNLGPPAFVFVDAFNGSVTLQSLAPIGQSATYAVATPVPEPGSVPLLGAAVVGLYFARRNSRKA